MLLRYLFILLLLPSLTVSSQIANAGDPCLPIASAYDRAQQIADTLQTLRNLKHFPQVKDSKLLTIGLANIPEERRPKITMAIEAFDLRRKDFEYVQFGPLFGIQITNEAEFERLLPNFADAYKELKKQGHDDTIKIVLGDFSATEIAGADSAVLGHRFEGSDAAIWAIRLPSSSEGLWLSKNITKSRGLDPSTAAHEFQHVKDFITQQEKFAAFIVDQGFALSPEYHELIKKITTGELSLSDLTKKQKQMLDATLTLYTSFLSEFRANDAGFFAFFKSLRRANISDVSADFLGGMMEQSPLLGSTGWALRSVLERRRLVQPDLKNFRFYSVNGIKNAVFVTKRLMYGVTSWALLSSVPFIAISAVFNANPNKMFGAFVAETTLGFSVSILLGMAHLAKGYPAIRFMQGTIPLPVEAIDAAVENPVEE